MKSTNVEAPKLSEVSHNYGSVKTLINQFVHLRHCRQMTQDEVDAIMGNTDRQVSKWECGVRTPRVFNLLCWAEALDATLILTPNDGDCSVPVDMQMHLHNADDYPNLH